MSIFITQNLLNKYPINFRTRKIHVTTLLVITKVNNNQSPFYFWMVLLTNKKLIYIFINIIEFIWTHILEE